METSSRTRRALAGGAIAVALGLGGLTVAAANPLGIVGAQDEDNSTTTTEDSTTTTTPPSGDETVPPGDEQGPGGRHRGPGFLDEVLDGLVEDGTLTQEQADAVRDGLKVKVDESHEITPVGRADRVGTTEGMVSPGLRNAFETAAEIIGVEPEALREGLRDGKSIAAIAEENDVSGQEVIDAIVAKATEVIDQKVADGDLDAERAGEIKANLPDHVARLVDATRPNR